MACSRPTDTFKQGLVALRDIGSAPQKCVLQMHISRTRRMLQVILQLWAESVQRDLCKPENPSAFNYLSSFCLKRSAVCTPAGLFQMPLRGREHHLRFEPCLAKSSALATQLQP